MTPSTESTSFKKYFYDQVIQSKLVKIMSFTINSKAAVSQILLIKEENKTLFWREQQWSQSFLCQIQENSTARQKLGRVLTKMGNY